MASCLMPTVSGFNEQVQTAKSNAKEALTEAEKNGTVADEYFVSVVTFNQAVTPMQWNVPAAEVAELTTETYVPNGSTAMLDAVGQTLAKLKAEVGLEDPDTSFLVVIISDGMENASREWNNSRLGELIQELKATGRWTFTYMGANQDLSVIRDSLHIDAGNIALYKSDNEGTLAAFSANTKSTERYFTARKMGLKSVDNFYSTDGKITDLTKDEKKDKA